MDIRSAQSQLTTPQWVAWVLDALCDLERFMFEVYTVIEDRIAVVAALPNRQQAERYLQTHDRSCISTLLVRQAPEQAGNRSFGNRKADEILERFQVGLMVARNGSDREAA